LDWDGIFEALHAVGYAGPMFIELAHVRHLDVLRRARAFVAGRHVTASAR
jgi:sugar phosphate isomerase/epimerase